MESFTVKRLRTKVVFKLLFIGLSVSFVPTFTLLGILASMDLATMTWGQSRITGVGAILLGPIYGMVFATFCTLFFGVFVTIGLVVYAKIRPIEIEYYSNEEPEHS